MLCVHILCNSLADGNAKQTEDVLVQPQNRNIALDKQGRENWGWGRGKLVCIYCCICFSEMGSCWRGSALISWWLPLVCWSFSEAGAQGNCTRHRAFLQLLESPVALTLVFFGFFSCFLSFFLFFPQSPIRMTNGDYPNRCLLENILLSIERTSICTLLFNRPPLPSGYWCVSRIPYDKQYACSWLYKLTSYL